MINVANLSSNTSNNAARNTNHVPKIPIETVTAQQQVEDEEQERDSEQREPEYTSSGKIRQFLINPLTGHLEPMPSDSSESEPESAVDNQDDFFSFPSPSNDRSNSIFSDDDADSNFSRRNDTTTNTDQSDSETTVKSTASEGSLKQQQQQTQQHSGRGKPPRDNPHSPAIPGEKIKLRLKLEKSEPVTPAYKVDVSFVNTPPSRKAEKTMSSKVFGLANSGIGCDEPRVPPLHISLRGRNASVVQIRKKEKKSMRDLQDPETAGLKRRGKLKKFKDAGDGVKMGQKKSLSMMIGGTTAGINKIPIINSIVVNTAATVAKINNALGIQQGGVGGKTNALLKESSSSSSSSCSSSSTSSTTSSSSNSSVAEVSRLQSAGTKPGSSKSSDVDDIPLNSRIPSPLKHKTPIVNQSNVGQQPLNKVQMEPDNINHTNEHKIGGGN